MFWFILNNCLEVVSIYLDIGFVKIIINGEYVNSIMIVVICKGCVFMFLIVLLFLYLWF